MQLTSKQIRVMRALEETGTTSGRQDKTIKSLLRHGLIYECVRTRGSWEFLTHRLTDRGKQMLQDYFDGLEKRRPPQSKRLEPNRAPDAYQPETPPEFAGWDFTQDNMELPRNV